MVQFQDLEFAASLFIAFVQTVQFLHNIDDFSSLQLVFIGGLPLCERAPYRETDDLDICVHPPALISPLQDTLVALQPGVFSVTFNRLVMRMSSGPIPVDLIPSTDLPFIPRSMINLADLSHTNLPLLQPLELIVTKAYCCGRRGSLEERQRDAEDVWRLIEIFPIHRPGVLTSEEVQIMQDAGTFLYHYAPGREWLCALPR